MKINKPKLLGVVLINFMLLLSGLAAPSAFGQSNQREALTWGIKGGVTVSNFYGDAVSNAEYTTGFTGGLFLNYRINNYLAVQPEVMFSAIGAELDHGLTGESGSAQYDLYYLNVPVLVKFYIPTNSFVTPNIYAGPQVGFKLYGESNGDELNDELKDVTFGLAFGAGVDFDVASSPTDFIRTVGLDVRYALGLTDVFDMPDEPEARNGVFLGSLIVGF